MGAGLLRRHYAKKEVVDLSEKTLTELKAMAKEKVLRVIQPSIKKF